MPVNSPVSPKDHLGVPQTEDQPAVSAENILQTQPDVSTGPEDDAAFAQRFREEQVRYLAYELWLGRDCPMGEAEQDWFKAEQILFGYPGAKFGA